MPDLAAHRLLELMRAQRRAESERDRHVRSSDQWESASDRLEELNERIWYLATFGSEAPEELTGGVQAALEVDPDDDLQFRRAVLVCVRRAVGDTSRQRLKARTHDRIASAEQHVEAALEAISTAQQRLRNEYPDATLTAERVQAEDDMIRLHAERDERIA
jgi:hypothetical protein